MAPRSSWKGFIKLSLVSVPVKAFTANQSSAEIRLNQLHEECNSRVKYQKVCPLHGEISNDEIVSGYEYSKGQYVVVDPGEIDKLRTENDRSVGIDGFIDATTIDPMYYSGRTYYLVPDGPVGQKPYALLVKAMTDGELHAIAKTVIAGKEQVVLVRPLDNMLTMSVLSYSAKIKSASSFQDELVETEITNDELKLTQTLIDASMIDEFDLGTYKDEYTTKLSQLIEAKVQGQELVAAPDPEEPKIVNLMEALKESVARAQAEMAPAATKSAKKKTTKKAKKKMAPSARKAKSKTTKKTG